MKKSQERFVYALLDPRKPGIFQYGNIKFDFEPYYIGKGAKGRIGKHFTEHEIVRNRNTPKLNKIKKIKEAGFIARNYYVIIDTFYDDDLAYDREAELILLIGRKDKNLGPLVNLNDGGKRGYGKICKSAGSNYEIMYGKEKSDELKQQRRERFMGEKNPMYGKPGHMLGKKMSDETKEKLRQSKIRAVLQIDLETNEVINEFPSAQKAAESLGISKSGIYNCISEKMCTKSAGGYSWRYK